MVAKVKTSDERRMLILKGKVLTLKGKAEQSKDEMLKTQTEIESLRKKGVR
jgi:hypothetical protein